MTDIQTNTVPRDDRRNSGIDLLRIVSMIMVVMLHVLGHGGVLETASRDSYLVLWFLEIGAYCAVNCYALISGYVGVSSRYKVSNFVLLWLRVLFYSVTVTLVFKCFCPGSIGVKSLLSAFFPVFSNQYWYFTSYALLFLFMPVLNEGLNRLPKRTLGFVLVAAVTVASVLRPLAKLLYGDVFSLFNGYSPLWLMILYLIGGWIRKYGLFSEIKKHRTGVFLALYFGAAVLTLLSKLAIQLISTKLWGAARYDGLFIHYQSATVLAEAVFLLLAFEKMELGPVFAKAVAFFSPLAFSVYLIHEHVQIKDNVMTGSLTWLSDLPVYASVPLLLCVVPGVFILCAVLDLPRHLLFKGLKLKERLQRLEERIKNRVGAA